MLYTLVMAAGDGVTKFFAAGYAAPQLFFFSGALVAAMSAIAARLRRTEEGAPAFAELRTGQWAPMALRSAMTVVAAVCFFYAFKYLPMAEVFIFIGLMPILAGLMARPVLGERVGWLSWGALGAGAVGVACLFPEGLGAVTIGHMIALGACFSGTLSMVLARYIGRRETKPLALVFYPNLTLCIVMGLVLPLVYRPMGLVDLGWAASYAVLLFAGRYMIVRALNMMSAHAVMALVNMQFVWMVLIGLWVFAEIPTANLLLGAAIVIASGMVLIAEQAQSARRRGPQGGGKTIDAPRYPPSLKWMFRAPRAQVSESRIPGTALTSRSLSHSHMSLSHSDYQSQISRQSVPR